MKINTINMKEMLNIKIITERKIERKKERMKERKKERKKEKKDSALNNTEIDLSD
jgi:hypothetical protein